MRLKGNNDKFLCDMEACQHGAVPGDVADTKENRELLELSQALSGKDFSQYSNRSAVLFKVRTMNNKQEANTMKNKTRIQTSCHRAERDTGCRSAEHSYCPAFLCTGYSR
ncbi:hypothetical protein HMSSN036_41960 [Paenibacillus macerans]|nr:hypothetical protein HMSSN036_41960 [Paenibacillus macerans]